MDMTERLFGKNANKELKVMIASLEGNKTLSNLERISKQLSEINEGIVKEIPRTEKEKLFERVEELKESAKTDKSVDNLKRVDTELKEIYQKLKKIS